MSTIPGFSCPLCNPSRIFGPYSTKEELGPEDIQDIAAEIKHDHWVVSHRICAICGGQVSKEEFDMAVNDGSIKIHSSYNDFYEKVRVGDKWGRMLTVHQKCIPSKGPA
jgi:hypothetical protein